jgi:hypothetical protein
VQLYHALLTAQLQLHDTPLPDGDDADVTDKYGDDSNDNGLGPSPSGRGLDGEQEPLAALAVRVLGYMLVDAKVRTCCCLDGLF